MRAVSRRKFHEEVLVQRQPTLGAHIVKVKAPTAHIEGDDRKKAYEGVAKDTLADRIRHVVKSSFAGRRIVIFSGGEAKATNDVLEELRRADIDGPLVPFLPTDDSTSGRRRPVRPLDYDPAPMPLQLDVPRLLGRKPRVRKVTRVVRHVDPWSVFKIALMAHLLVYVILLVAGVLLWNVANATGTVDNVERFFESFGFVNLAEQTLFQTRFTLPTNLVEGTYAAKFFLVRKRAVISSGETLITVEKAGIERWLYNLAQDQPLRYGLLSVALAPVTTDPLA